MDTPFLVSKIKVYDLGTIQNNQRIQDTLTIPKSFKVKFLFCHIKSQSHTVKILTDVTYGA